ncbi:endoglucanase [Edaphobacter aggregans]|uniref:Endoglucanase n=1 Tax=Edaphobacter aggregans TaxID=570835 RepID=A0A3R9QBB3_9BACT|nr:cellulase family glycosylhydrolase [Edaphobacter aggregans]RSL17135.1 endoglucanase [Edaphobacter aggregans]
MNGILSFFLAVCPLFALIITPFQTFTHPIIRVATHQAIPAPKHRVVLAAMRAPDTGYWHTSGNQILDERNQPVRIEGINWYGFETVRQVPGGLTVQDYRTILQTIKRNGFNTVRIPLSNQMIERPVVPKNIGFENEQGTINTDLRGLSSLEILDRIVEYAGTLGLKVILDNHRSEAGDSAEQSGLWYTNEYPESAWIGDWESLVRRYAGNSTVVGVDLRNEPHNANSGGACWDCGGERDWHQAAERGGNAVLRVNPRLIVFVEGVDAYDNDSYWWGGNLEGVRRSPVRLKVANQLVYSPHTYGPNEYAQKWFNTNTTAASLEAVWVKHWAYVSLSGIAPVWVGEFGTTNKTEDIRGNVPGSEGQWFQSLVQFLGKHQELSWTSWALNGEDANGLLNAHYDAAANVLKQEMLASIMSPAVPAVAAEAVVARVVSPMAGRERRSEACHVSYRSRNESRDGFTGTIEIANTGDKAIEGWTLLWLYTDSQEIGQARNARVAQRGDMVMMSNTGENGVIPAGGRLAGISFQSSYRGVNRRPVKFYLNGSLCG